MTTHRSPPPITADDDHGPITADRSLPTDHGSRAVLARDAIPSASSLREGGSRARDPSPSASSLRHAGSRAHDASLRQGGSRAHDGIPSASSLRQGGSRARDASPSASSLRHAGSRARRRSLPHRGFDAPVLARDAIRSASSLRQRGSRARVANEASGGSMRRASATRSSAPDCDCGSSGPRSSRSECEGRRLRRARGSARMRLARLPPADP